MGILITVVVIVVLVALAGFLMLRRRRDADDAIAAAPAVADESTPMTGLESALDQATDRSGRPIRERLDDESSIVDDLRVPDDTGPLLRRALDHVAQPPDADGGDGDTGVSDEGGDET